LLTLCAACEQAGATTIISGCTELPLVLWPERVAAATQSEREINLLNPAEVLADEVVFRTLRTRSLGWTACRTIYIQCYLRYNESSYYF
jgi:aspartate/glutamate racemase